MRLASMVSGVQILPQVRRATSAGSRLKSTNTVKLSRRSRSSMIRTRLTT